MSVVGSGRSSLNPDAPVFIPAAYRLVEDFSPDWWHLVTTSSCFRDYWLAQHPHDGAFSEDCDGDDVADMLPDSFDLDPALEDYFSSLDDNANAANGVDTDSTL